MCVNMRCNIPYNKYNVRTLQYIFGHRREPRHIWHDITAFT